MAEVSSRSEPRPLRLRFSRTSARNGRLRDRRQRDSPIFGRRPLRVGGAKIGPVTPRPRGASPPSAASTPSVHAAALSSISTSQSARGWEARAAPSSSSAVGRNPSHLAKLLVGNSPRPSTAIAQPSRRGARLPREIRETVWPRRADRLRPWVLTSTKRICLLQVRRFNSLMQKGHRDALCCRRRARLRPAAWRCRFASQTTRSPPGRPPTPTPRLAPWRPPAPLTHPPPQPPSARTGPSCAAQPDHLVWSKRREQMVEQLNLLRIERTAFHLQRRYLHLDNPVIVDSVVPRASQDGIRPRRRL